MRLNTRTHGDIQLNDEQTKNYERFMEVHGEVTLVKMVNGWIAFAPPQVVTLKQSQKTNKGLTKADHQKVGILETDDVYDRIQKIANYVEKQAGGETK